MSVVFLQLYDVRMYRDSVMTFRGHQRDVTSCSWHPVHEELLVSGSYDGQVRGGGPGEGGGARGGGMAR